MFLREIDSVSMKSDDPRTKVGAVIAMNGAIISSGSNTLTNGVNIDLVDLHGDEKYTWIEHAERNAIYEAAKNGVALDGSEIHLKWFPCAECARAIAQAGISKVFCGAVPEENGKYMFLAAREILVSAGVEIVAGYY